MGMAQPCVGCGISRSLQECAHFTGNQNQNEGGAWQIARLDRLGKHHTEANRLRPMAGATFEAKPFQEGWLHPGKVGVALIGGHNKVVLISQFKHPDQGGAWND